MLFCWVTKLISICPDALLCKICTTGLTAILAKSMRDLCTCYCLVHCITSVCDRSILLSGEYLSSISLASGRCGFSRMVPQRLLQIIHGSANTNFSKRPNLYSRWHSMASTFTWSCCMSLLPMGLLRFEIAAISLAMVEKVMLNFQKRLH